MKFILFALIFASFVETSYSGTKEYSSFCPASVSLNVPSVAGKHTRWNPKVGPDYAAAQIVPKSFPFAKIIVSNIKSKYTDLVCLYTNTQVAYAARVGCNDVPECNCAVSPSNPNSVICTDK